MTTALIASPSSTCPFVHGGMRRVTGPDRGLDQADRPGEAADGVLGRELPVDDHPLVRHDAPQHVEHRAGDGAVRLRDQPVVCGSSAASSAARWRALASATVSSRGVRGATGNVDTYSSIRAVTAATSSSARPSTATPDSSSNRANTASRSIALGREVPVDRSFGDAGTFGGGAHGERRPVPRGEAVEQLGAGGEDAFPGLGGALATDGAVVLAARLRGVGHPERATARGVGASPTRARSTWARGAAPAPSRPPTRGNASAAPRARRALRGEPTRHRGRSARRTRR